MNLIGQGCHYAWVWLMDLVEASGMTKPVFIGFIITTAVLATVFGTLRGRAFSGGDKFGKEPSHNPKTSKGG